MKMNKKIFITISLSIMAIVPVCESIKYNSIFGLETRAADECTHHHGYHYVAKDPTIDESGWKEFWACCECGHQYIGTAPEGDWTTRDASLMVGGLSSFHIAYLAPLTSGGSSGDYWITDPFDDL